MTASMLLLSWAVGAVFVLVGLGAVIKPANRDGWLVTGLMGLVWPLTLLVVLAAFLLEDHDR